MNNTIYRKIAVCKQHLKSLKTISLICFLSLTSCQKNIYLPLQYQTKTSFDEKIATKNQPAKFYVCDSRSYPCRKVTNRWLSVSKKNFKGEN